MSRSSVRPLSGHRNSGVHRPPASESGITDGRALPIPRNPAATPDMAGDKIRFRFHKADELRLLSHHDLMRCTERMLRRAELPFKSTAGFHPMPRFVFEWRCIRVT